MNATEVAAEQHDEGAGESSRLIAMQIRPHPDREMYQHIPD